MKFFLLLLMYFEQQSPNLMSITVSQNQKPSVIQKIIFQIIDGFRIKRNQTKKASAVQLLIKVLLSFKYVSKKGSSEYAH